jgi:hypothetical protein
MTLETPDSALDPLHTFQVHLKGLDSVVIMDGSTLHGIRDVKIHQPLDGLPVITIEFVAESVTGIDHAD